jgi:hypothetical protein
VKLVAANSVSSDEVDEVRHNENHTPLIGRQQVRENCKLREDDVGTKEIIISITIMIPERVLVSPRSAEFRNCRRILERFLNL